MTSPLNRMAPLLLTAGLATYSPGSTLSYPVVATGQAKCYDASQEIAPPRPGQAFYGQDSQFQTCPARYTPAHDGLTVRDEVTGLTWQRSPDVDGDGAITHRDKLTWAQAKTLPAKLNAANFGGFKDWRLPSIKELYSLFDARGTDPSGPMDIDPSRLTPFIDTKYFKFAYGDPKNGERIIDSQYASSTKYVGNSVRQMGKVFGVNFADGRIKGYDLQVPGRDGEKTFFVIGVRGNPAYGRNDFHDNRDGTITDRATGLTWSKDDSGLGLNWRDALAWVQKNNAEKFLGHADWRLPSIKELQGIVDYTRSPDTSQSAAIDPVFHCSTITNEAHEVDFPFYWSATTHAGLRGGSAAMYVAFGRAPGWMPPRRMIGPPGSPPGARPGRVSSGPLPSRREARPQRNAPGAPGPAPEARSYGNYHYVDVHGAGAQRSDPKAGDPAMFPHGRGPQGDVIRIYNYVRLVRTSKQIYTPQVPFNW